VIQEKDVVMAWIEDDWGDIALMTTSMTISEIAIAGPMQAACRWKQIFSIPTSKIIFQSMTTWFRGYGLTASMTRWFAGCRIAFDHIWSLWSTSFWTTNDYILIACSMRMATMSWRISRDEVMIQAMK
jgi:hypothetical protein